MYTRFPKRMSMYSSSSRESIPESTEGSVSAIEASSPSTYSIRTPCARVKETSSGSLKATSVTLIPSVVSACISDATLENAPSANTVFRIAGAS